MTEEITIDGVDVAGCNFRLERDNKQKCECCHATDFGVICDCEALHNCYYKQLKRLEFELKVIKADYEASEQENKELKEDVLKWQKAFSRQYQINENKGYSKVEESYRSALEEISGLASPHCTQCSQIIKIVNEVLQ